MALGNWAILAVRLDGKVIDAVEVDWPASVSGVVVEIYKNWAYVSDGTVPKRLNDAFTRPEVMEIQHGMVRYADWTVLARRGPQDGIYLAAWSTDYRKKSGPFPTVGFVGCGVSGYDDNGKWVGVEPRSADFLRSWIAKMRDELPSEVSAVVVDDSSISQGNAFFARNLPKMRADPSFNPEKAR